jgi:hypothetical protein
MRDPWPTSPSTQHQLFKSSELKRLFSELWKLKVTWNKAYIDEVVKSSVRILKGLCLVKLFVVLFAAKKNSSPLLAYFTGNAKWAKKISYVYFFQEYKMLFDITVGTQIPDKSGIRMVDFRKNRASNNWTVQKPNKLDRLNI